MSRRARTANCPRPGGLRGKNCHQDCPASASRSIQATAGGPKSPIPHAEGSELTCSKSPDERGITGGSSNNCQMRGWTSGRRDRKMVVFQITLRKRRAVIKKFRWMALATIAMLSWVGAAPVSPIAADGPAAPPAASKSKAAQPATKAGDSKSDKKDKAAEPLTFMRVRRGAHNQPLALETATGHYVSTQGKPVTVDLIGAIHIGDKDYYHRLNERFRTYDKVLFELVMPEGQSLKGLGDHRSNHPIGMLQQSLPSVLDLDYQLKAIDYTAKNFKHADLSPDEMAAAIRKRGDNGASIGIKVFFDLLSQANRTSEAMAKKGRRLQRAAAAFRPVRSESAAGTQKDVCRADGFDRRLGDGPGFHARHHPGRGPQCGSDEGTQERNRQAERGGSPSSMVPPTCPTSTAD